jgi:choice-of-anchor B domain-containing protein
MKFSGSSLLVALAMADPSVKAMEASKTKMYEVMMPLKMAAHANGVTVDEALTAAEKIKAFTDTGVVHCDPDTGMAGGEDGFACKDMDLVNFLTGVELGSPYASNPDPYAYSTFVSDIWGWVDPIYGNEYALVGMWDGTSIVDITDPRDPEVVIFVETTRGVTDGLDGRNNLWRDIKVINDVMYIGSMVPFHGLQTFDLTQLRELSSRGMGKKGKKAQSSVSSSSSLSGKKSKKGKRQLKSGAAMGKKGSSKLTKKDSKKSSNTAAVPIVMGVPIVSPTYITSEIGATHNLVAAPEALKIIGVGIQPGDKTCPGKFMGTENETLATLAIFDVSIDPLVPAFEQCIYLDDNVTSLYGNRRGYVHDAHCIKYDGPDTRYTGINLCALFMEDDVVIYDIDNFEVINLFTYTNAAYVHQGWFSEDHTTLYADDELDELYNSSGTQFSTCYIFDMTDLGGEIPEPKTFLTPSAHASIDHNLYVKDGYIYQAAYTSGARVRKIKDDMTIEEVAFFDTDRGCECVDPDDDVCACDYFTGVWTHFPYFDSGLTIAGGISEGLFILKPTF